jgi:transketolase
MNAAEMAKQIRLKALELSYKKGTSHLGGALSVADILAVLYAEVLNISPEIAQKSFRDRLFYSKGHACTALYSALDLCGFFPSGALITEFTADGSYFTSHINHRLPGIELSTGSLGHALGVACGVALAGKRRSQTHNVFAILSDGELDEGSNWEAIMFAAHNKLDNLIAVVDYNKIQSFGLVKDIMNLDPLADKFKAFNWKVCEVDGHSIDELKKTFTQAKFDRSGSPKCVIAHTVKGKGVSFMENQLSWHYKSPTELDYQAACLELKATKDA